MQRKRWWILPVAALLFLGLLCACTRAPKTVTKNAVSMGSVVTVKAYGEKEEPLQTAADSALSEIAALDENVLSKTLSSSELYKLNHEDHTAGVKVSAELFDALYETKQIYTYSNGKATLASGALTSLWGMDTDEFRVPSNEEIERARALCKDDTVTLSDDGTVSFGAEQQLNLGSVGKGIACDKAVEVLRENGFGQSVTGAVVSVGGSVATLGEPEQGKQWTVGVRNPFGTANDYFATLSVGDAFLSTSGTYEKQFTVDGKTYHHLLDLTTGYPAETTLCSVTVLAETGLQSDALSTLCFLLGEEASREVLELYSAEAVFVYQDKTVHVTDGLQSAFRLTDDSFQWVNA